MTSYLIQAQQKALMPYDSGNADLGVIRQALRAELPQGMADILANGLRLLAFLQYIVEQEQAQVFTSRLTLAEMWYGRLDGQAHIRMALAGIPYRQRQRQSDISVLVMSRLTQADYDTVEQELDSFLGNLGTQFGIDIFFIEDNDSTSIRDVTQLALQIQKRTFLDVIDCMLFASSLALLARDFKTGDGHLRTVINRVKNPNSIQDPDERSLWQAVQAVIVEGLQELHLDDSINHHDLVEAKSPGRLPKEHLEQLHIV